MTLLVSVQEYKSITILLQLLYKLKWTRNIELVTNHHGEQNLIATIINLVIISKPIGQFGTRLHARW